MKTTYPLIAAFSFFILHFSLFTSAQVLCIKCYNQNARVLTDTNNLILNGGFENGCPGLGYFCPNSTHHNCNITNWICTGGGHLTYAQITDTNSNFTVIVEGAKAAYFGNHWCNPCTSHYSDSSCLYQIGCQVFGMPSGYPVNNLPGYGGDTGVSLSQTVSGLTIGANYELEFWAGGEFGVFIADGLFAVDVGFGNIFLRDPPTPPILDSIGRRFIIVFTASSASHTIKFTNWGHRNDSAYDLYYTELILDDVRLFAAPADSQLCASGINEPTKNAVTVSPNPFTSSFTIKTGRPARVVVYNVLGERLTPNPSPKERGEIQILLDAPAGVYFVRVEVEGVVSVLKLVKIE